MKKRYLLCCIILTSLFLSQIGISTNFQYDTITSKHAFSMSGSNSPVYHPGIVDTPFSKTLNVTSERLVVRYDIEEPSVLSFEYSLHAISAISNVGFDIDIDQSASTYIPQLDVYSFGSEFFDMGMAILSTGMTVSDNGMVYATEPGFLIFDFLPTWGHSLDEVQVNITVEEHYVLTDTTDVGVGDETIWSPIANNTWSSFHFSIGDGSLFNISLESVFDYDTPSYWAGGYIHPIYCILFDLQHGYRGKWVSYSTSFSLPAGANSGSESWSDFDVMNLPQGEYYLTMNAKEFDNLGLVNLTFKIENVDTIPLTPNDVLELEFGDSETNEFILEVSPEYYYLNDLSFDISGGANWSVTAMNWPSTTDVFSAERYEDSTIHYVNELRYTDFILIDSLLGLEAAYPSPSLTGESHGDRVLCYGHWYDDVNGTIEVLDAFTWVKNKFPKFYFTVIAEPIDSIHTESFNVSLMLDSDPIPDISEGITILDFNLTSGPCNFFYKVPVESGTIVDARITPAGYGSLEAVFLQIYPDVQTKNNWQVTYEPYLTWGDHIDTMPYRVSYMNDATELSVMAVHDGYMIINPYSWASYPSDLTKAQLEVTITNPTDYVIGDTINAELNYANLVAYKFDVTEGALYEYEVELSGVEASSVFTNSEGYSPFHQSGFEPYTHVNPSTSMKQTALYTGKENDTGVIAFVGEGAVDFTIKAMAVEPIETTVTEYVNSTVYLDSNTTEYDRGYTDGRNFGMLVVGAGFIGLVIVVLILKRR